MHCPRQLRGDPPDRYPVTMHPGRVSTSVRIIVAAYTAYTAYAAWMAVWVADQSERLATILPAGWTVAFWLAAWVTMAGIGAWAAITGKDCPVRVALVLVAALSAASLLAVVADTRPARHAVLAGR